MEIVQAVKKLNSISRARLNFRRRPFLCTNLYRNPIQASNFGGSFDQLFLEFFLCNFHRRCASTFSIQWCKKFKMTKNSNQGGGGGSGGGVRIIAHFRLGVLRQYVLQNVILLYCWYNSVMLQAWH